MSSHGDAVLEVGAAEQVGEVLGLGALGVEGADHDPAVAQVVPAPPAGRGTPARASSGIEPGSASRCGHPLGRDQQPRAEAPGGAQRDHVGGRAVGSRELGREVEDAAHLGAPEPVDRLVRVADDGQVAAVAGERPEQRDLAGVGVLVLVDEDVAQLGPELVAVDLGLDGGAADQVGVVDGALAVEAVEVLVEEEPGGHELRQPSASPSSRSSSPSRPFSRARDSTVCTSRAKPRVPSARCQRVGPGDRLGVVGEQLAEHDVLLGGGLSSRSGAS